MKWFFRHPSAWLPVAMSAAALSLLLGYLAFYALHGISSPHEEDEGTGAHLFQLLMGGQVPIILFFMARWLPEMGKHALKILVLQFIAGLCAFAPLYISGM